MANESYLSHKDERSIKSMAKERPSLPHEIIVEEILLRLPVKSLLQFRCVSKSWSCLISHPQFANKHLSQNDYDYTRHRLIVLSGIKRRGGVNYKTCSLPSVLYEQSATAPQLDCPITSTVLKVVSTVGSCNGLVCVSVCVSWNVSLVSHSLLFLLNPTTRKWKRLRPLNYRYQGIKARGFGYDESTNDYKVVGMEAPGGIVMVYTLKIDSWRRIQDFPCGYTCSDRGILVSGALHWFGYNRGTKPDHNIIVSLDLAKEKYGEVVQPPNCGNSGYRLLRLCVLGGCLCALCSTCDAGGAASADVWVMKEYGVRESWTKLFMITYPIDPVTNTCYHYEYSGPLCVSNINGEILLGSRSGFLLYNPKGGGTFRCPVIDNWDRNGGDTYIESLVSPNVIREQHQYYSGV